jgi:hypothetical protein
MNKSKNKARAIAKDALKQIKLGVLIPSTRIYFTLADDSEISHGESLQTLIQDQKIKCSVCALGALFASKISLDNEYSLSDAWRATSIDMQNLLQEAFTRKELLLIECVFEQWSWKHDEDPKLQKKISNQIFLYGRIYDDPARRMKAILRNIVRNGEFKFPLWQRILVRFKHGIGHNG